MTPRLQHHEFAAHTRKTSRGNTCVPRSGALLLVLALSVTYGCSDQVVRPELDASVEAPASTAATYRAASLFGDENLLPMPTEAARPRLGGSEAARAPAGGEFPVVLVQPRGEASGATGAPVVDNFLDAVSRVKPGGTIRVFPGTYRTADRVFIEKSVVIEALSGSRPVVVNQSGRSFIATGAGVVVTVEGLAFENHPLHSSHSSVSAEHGGTMIVRDGVFLVAGGTAGAFAWEGGRLVVEESDFMGGEVGALASHDATEMVVRGSSFRGHRIVAVQHQRGADGLVESNVASDCGVSGCAVVFGGEVDVVGNRFSESRTDFNPFTHHVVLYSGATGSVAGNVFDGCGHGTCFLAVVGADVDVVGNEFTVYGTHETTLVIVGSDGSGGVHMLPPPTLLVTDNVITGVGESSSGYGIVHTSIQAEFGTTLRAYRNTVSNVANGLAAWNGGIVVDARDNVFDDVRFGIGAWHGSRVTANFNDVTNAGLWPIEIPDSDPNLSDLTCNWWGDAAGPENPNGVPSSLYAPWATAPVAGLPRTC